MSVSQLKTRKDESQYILNKTGKKAGKILYSAFRYLVLLSIGYLIIYPLLYMIVTSCASGEAYNNSVRVWIPNDFDIRGNFGKAIEIMDYGRAFISTFKNEISSALIQVISCSIAGYGFARYTFKGKRFFTALLFLSILVPDMVVIVPKMLNYSHVDFFGILGIISKLTGKDIRLDITDTPLSFWLPAILGVGLKSGVLIYIYIQFFKGLPRELEEAAWVDGSGPLRTFLSIALPSSSVVIVTVTVFSLIWHWNDFLLSGMYLRDNFPLAVKLTSFETVMYQKYMIGISRDTPEGAGVLMAGLLLFVLPMLIFYMIIQRQFIESIDRVGITG